MFFGALKEALSMALFFKEFAFVYGKKQKQFKESKHEFIKRFQLQKCREIYKSNLPSEYFFENSKRFI